MSIVTIKLNNKSFPIACEDGQEQALSDAVATLNNRIDQLKHASPTATTEYLLLLCAISLQDELINLKRAAKNSGLSSKEEMLLNTLNDITDYIEALAQNIKK